VVVMVRISAFYLSYNQARFLLPVINYFTLVYSLRSIYSDYYYLFEI